MFDGTASLDEFKSNGVEFLEIYKRMASLQRSRERMLDVGSGIGRKTIQLTQYFDESSSYEGIDICMKGVEWCRERITARYPNFRFTHIDVFNRLYNPDGRLQPSDYRFPFDDGSFTFVMLGSVFTHMLPRDVEHYLSEAARVLETGQRCLISYFLLNASSRAADGSSLVFRSVDDLYATTSPDLPETAIALDEAFVRNRYEQTGLTIEAVEYGSWSGRSNTMSYQDLILARKR